MNVRPKFFQLVREGIQCSLCHTNVDVATERAGAGMVHIGDACGYAITEEFREVELTFPGVRARDQNPHGSVPGTVEEFSFSHLVVARVLPQQRREYGARHKVSTGGVSKRRSVAFGIANQPLAIGRVRIVSLIDAGLHADEREFNRIEDPHSHNLEFLSGRKRR